jgi:hypothetical protein
LLVDFQASALAVVDVDDGTDETGGLDLAIGLGPDGPSAQHEPDSSAIGDFDSDFSFKGGFGRGRGLIAIRANEVEKLIAILGMDVPRNLVE